MAARFVETQSLTDDESAAEFELPSTQNLKKSVYQSIGNRNTSNVLPVISPTLNAKSDRLIQNQTQ